jgi:hypothetical protein
MMTAALAREIAEEMAAYWQGQGLTARTAWLALTGARRRYASWDECVGEMMRWELRQDAAAAMKRAA